MPVPILSFVKSASNSGVVTTLALTLTTPFAAGAGHVLILGAFNSSYGFWGITSVTDDGGNVWTPYNGGANFPDPDFYYCLVSNPTTQITVHYSPFGPLVSVTASLLIGEYAPDIPVASISQLRNGGNNVSQVALSQPGAQLIGFFEFNNNASTGALAGPFAGGVVRNSISGLRGSGLGGNENGGLALIDDLSGVGTVSESTDIAVFYQEINVFTPATGGPPPPPNGTIVVQKSTNPSGSPQAFQMNPSWKASFNLTDGGSDSTSVAPGTYSFTETPVAGWMTNIVVSNGSPINAITVASGETVTIFVTNTQTVSPVSKIIVVKATNPGGATQPFTFRPSWGPPFILMDGQSNDSGNLAPGIYSITEDPVTGWKVTTSQDPSAIVLGANQIITITFTNTMSHIIVKKVTNPSGSVQGFNFSTNYGPNFTLTDGETNDSGPLPPGTYSVTESPVTGWMITTSQDPTAIVLGSGQTVTITFTNTGGGPPPPCSYTLGTAVQLLADRLNDPLAVFYTQPELIEYIYQSLRFWNVLTGENRVWFNLNISNPPPVGPVTPQPSVWYDLLNNESAPNSPRLAKTQDSDLYSLMQYLLLEPQSGVPLTLGTKQFSVVDWVYAVQSKRDEFLLDTGCVSQIRPIIVVPGQPSIALPSTVIQARRAYWVPNVPAQGIGWGEGPWGGPPGWGGITIFPPNPRAFPLMKVDERQMAGYLAQALSLGGDPIVYSAGVEPPYIANVYPPPPDSGVIEFITQETQSLLSAATPTLLYVPDDYVPGIAWGAIHYLLSMSLERGDKYRSDYALMRFRQYTDLMRIAPTVLGARMGAQPFLIDAVETLDAYIPNWRGQGGFTQPIVALSGRNLVAFPTPSSGQISLLVVANAVLPPLLSTCIMVGNEVMQVILDYAQHVASFKMGAKEVEDTMPLFRNMLLLASERNAKIKALSSFREIMYGYAGREDSVSPTRDTDDTTAQKTEQTNTGVTSKR